MAQISSKNVAVLLMLISIGLQFGVVCLPTLAVIRVELNLKVDQSGSGMKTKFLESYFKGEDKNFYLNIDAFKVCQPISKTCYSELHSVFTNSL